MISAKFAKELSLRTTNLEKIEEIVRKAASEGKLEVKIPGKNLTQAELFKLEELGYKTSSARFDYILMWKSKTE